MICPTAIEAAKRILDAAHSNGTLKAADAIAVAIELLSAKSQDATARRMLEHAVVVEVGGESA